MKDDAELLRCYHEDHSQAAFTELVHRRIDLVYSTALRRVGGDAHLAEDVAQRVFTALAQKAGSLRHHASLTGWLFVCTHHEAAATVRVEQRRKRREERAMNDPLPTVSDPEHRDELKPAIDNALLKLRSEDRDALVYRFIEQRSLAEVASQLRTTEEAARKRVDRALEKLRLVLARQGITSSTTALGAVLAGFAVTAVPTRVAAEVASQAMVNAATGSAASGLLTGALKLVVPTAAALAGGWLLVWQHGVNQRLQAELQGLRTDAVALTTVSAENQRLRDRMVAVEHLRLAADAAATPASVTTTASSPISARPVFAHVRITPQHTLEWNGVPVTLNDFIEKLKAAGSDPTLADSRIVVRAPDLPFEVVSFVLDEGCKAEVKHLVIESNTTPKATGGVSTWF